MTLNVFSLRLNIKCIRFKAHLENYDILYMHTRVHFKALPDSKHPQAQQKGYTH